MAGYVGFASGALQLGAGTVLMRPAKRGFYNIIDDSGLSLLDIVAQAVFHENGVDEMEITVHPVEQGAAMNDHMFKLPAEVTLYMGWSNSPSPSLSGAGGVVNSLLGSAASANSAVRNALNTVEIAAAAASVFSGWGMSAVKAVYQNLLVLQTNRALFNLYTGKRVYQNMACKSLSVQTDEKTENALMVTMVCREVITVQTQTASLPAAVQANPAKTASPLTLGINFLNPVGG